MFNNDKIKKLCKVALASTLAATGFLSVKPAVTNAEEHNEIENVIFMIGDGMGPAYTTGYRHMADSDQSNTLLDPTVFDEYLVGMQTTHPDDPVEDITDSAAAATAMASGIKTYNGAIGVDNDESEAETIIERAVKSNKSTGIVATSQINHATPAAYGSHDASRKNYDAIANDYFDNMIDGEHVFDVMLGGGTNYYDRDDRNLTEEFQNDGYDYVTSREEMMASDADQVLGLFAPVGLPKMIDRTDETPSLEEMTTTAIEKLERDEDGFFLMVEGSQIDWAGHDNDVVGAMSEMEDFAQAFEAVMEYARKDEHTLVITTADHSTGGLSIGARGPYEFDPAPIKAAKRTPDWMSEQIASGEDAQSILEQYIDFDLTEDELQSVLDAEKNAKEGEVQGDVDAAIERIFDVRSGTGWTSSGHTAVDVPVYAFGPGSDQFAGLIDNTDQANKLFEILKNNAGDDDDQGENEGSEFEDVKEGDFGYEEIMKLYRDGIIKGYSKTEFKPDLDLNRGQAALLFMRALDLEATNTEETPFSDMDESSPYYEAAVAAKEAGIFEGNGKGEFNGKDSLTREQMASVLVRAFDLEGDSSDVEIKDEEKIAGYHKEDVVTLYQNGITTGHTDGTFAPKDEVSRAQFSVFLYRATK
ncbi:alkaline phosphatase [Halobacillus salinus]|uniref:Alkaline phosphatase n=1 Tax=Halobacillus salinus TaxID=192814 RepID=A0A4Z0GX80_9BACI|nr:alkaline phosphatase [Halobacillus salinus]